MTGKIFAHLKIFIPGVLLLCIVIPLIIGAKSCNKRTNDNTKSGSSDYSTFIINAPSNLTATAISSSQINLSWTDNSINEDGFEIDRSTDGVGYVLLVTLNLDLISYSDIGLAPMLTYYYRVRAFNTIGDRSNYSNNVNIILKAIWMDIFAGYNHVIGRLTNYTIWSWGNNEYGQLGLNDNINRMLPAQVGIETDWSDIAAGEAYTVALKNDSDGGVTLWAWGYNGEGQLGDGTAGYDSPIPVQVGNDTDWFKIAAGNRHIIAMKANQTIWSWGFNDFSQLGLGNTSFTYAPTQIIIGSDSDWLMIIAGGNQSFSIKTNCTLWGWGNNNNGELGLGHYYDRNTPTQVTSNSDWSNVATTGYIMQYAGPFGHTIAIKTNGTIWSWGLNEFGQLGIGNVSRKYIPTLIGTDSDWVKIAAGNWGNIEQSGYSMAMKANGTLWAWGSNYYGQLGLGLIGGKITTPVQIGVESDWFTANEINPFRQRGIALGNAFTLVQKLDGTIFSWGMNQYGQLGLGDTVNRSQPCQIGSPIPVPPTLLSALVISNIQINLSWTDNSDREEGFIIERKIGSNGIFVPLSTIGSNIVFYSDITNAGFAPSTSYYYRVKAYNNFGESGYIGTGTLISGDWARIECGTNHTVGYKTNGTISGWGNNMYGQLGLNDTNNRMNPVQIFIDSDWSIIALGAYYSLALKTDPAGAGTLWAWGFNSYGQLGVGDTQNRFTPNQIAGTDWDRIDAGNNHTLALKTDNSLWAWGRNEYGQLGFGYTMPSSTGVTTPTMVGFDSDWSIVIGGGGSPGGPSAVTGYSVGIKTNQTIWAWGSNNYGQLGDGTNTARSTPRQIGSDSNWSAVSCGNNHTVSLKSDVTIWSWGNNWYAQLGLGDSGSTTNRNSPTQIGSDSDWEKISAGGFHTIVLKTNQTIWVWGRNYSGQLGLGDTDVDRNTPTQIGTESDWNTVTAGSNHSTALKSNRTVWVWGYNGQGQLGVGDTIDRIEPVLISE